MISVVIPALNEEQLIGPCLRSVRDQAFHGNYEVIVVDNGSTDDTVQIAEKHADYVFIEEQKGKYAAANTGARQAHGNILAFLDADTIVQPNWLSTIHETFQKPAIVGATCLIKPIRYSFRKFVVFTLYHQFVKYSIKLGITKTWGAVLVVRKNVFNQVDGFNKMPKFEDQDLVARIRDKGKFTLMEDTFAETSPERLEQNGLLGSIKHYIIDYFAQALRDRM